MEDRENESITAIAHFKTQLAQLRNTFLGVPLEDRTAAVLAVRSLLDELLQLCMNHHSINQNCKSIEQVYEDSVCQISSFALENTQSSNDHQQTCINDQGISLPDSNVNIISKGCLETQHCELVPVGLTNKSSEVRSCRNLEFLEINDPVTQDAVQSINTLCKKKSESVYENQPNQLSYNLNYQPMDIAVSQQSLPEASTVTTDTSAVLNDCIEAEGKEVTISITLSSQDPCATACAEENVHSMGFCKRTGFDEGSEVLELNKDEIVVGNSPSLNSLSESVTTASTLPTGRITRSMARINHRKQKIKSQLNKGRIRSKRKVTTEYSEPSVYTDNSTKNGLDSQSEDISNLPQSDQDIQELITNDEQSAKKRKISEGQKKTVKSAKRAKLENNKESALDSSSACLLVCASGMVSCRQCHLEFKNYATFNKHTCKSDKRVFTCKHCDLYFNRPQKFQNHVNNHIRNNCKICGAQFTKREALNKHNKSEHHGLVEPEKYYHCPLCEQKFVKKPSLYAHLKEHADLKIVCMKCGAMCDGEEQYNQHMAKHAEEANYHCDKCNENFLWRQQYEQHIAGHEKYKCSLCDTNFCTKKQMVKHRRMVHGIKIQEEKKHECPICQKRFQRQTMLKMHIAMHNGETPLQCSVCSKNYRTFKSLSKHMKTAAHLKQSGQSDEKPSALDKSFLCAECGAKFYRKQGLARHMQQLHSEDRPFECSFCDYTCKCKTNLKRHVELHKNERRFVCELCGSSFHAHGTLKEHHAYVHSEDRQFVCQKCGKGFKGRSGLRRHIRSHSDNRPFVCYCGQSYKRMSHLKRHMMSIHGMAFKSKRVQRIGSDDQGSSTHDDSNPSTNFQYVEPITDLAPFDGALQPQTITLPVTATNGLLIIDNPSQGPQEMAQSMTLEVTDVVPCLDIPQGEPHLLPQEMGAVDQFSVQNSTHVPLSPTSSCMLPSIMDTSDLNQSFDLGNVSIPLSHCGISVAPTLPSLNPQTIYHTVQTLDSALAFPLQSSISDLTNPTMQTLPPEFYTQSLAQYMSCSQPELI